MRSITVLLPKRQVQYLNDQTDLLGFRARAYYLRRMIDAEMGRDDVEAQWIKKVKRLEKRVRALEKLLAGAEDIE